MSDEPIPYGRQSIDEDDVAAVAEVLRGQWLTTGPAVEGFEEAVSQVAGGHPVVAVSSGTAALHAAYAAAGIGADHELITTPLTFAATATAALHLGAAVRFADVDESTLNVAPTAVAAQIGPRTRAVAAVDYAGQPADMVALRELADDHGLVLVEDAAHSIGARLGDRPVGDLADLTTFSFHPVKTITTGEGGAVVVREQGYLDAVRAFRNHGLVRTRECLRRPEVGPWHQEVQSLGLNYRMPDVLAALGTSQLRKLERFVARRQRLVERYRTALADVEGLRLLHVDERCRPAWHLFPVRVLGGRRREVVEQLRAQGILVQVHYMPVHHHPLFEDLGYRRGMCPVAEMASEEVLSLPLYPDLTERQQDRVIEEVRAVLGG